MANEIHVGDVGTEIIGTIKDGALIVDVSSGSCVFLIQLPNKTVISRTAAPVTSGSDGQVHYFTVAGDLPVKGKYKLQAYLILPDWTGHSDVVEIEVEDNLNPV